MVVFILDVEVLEDGVDLLIIIVLIVILFFFRLLTNFFLGVKEFLMNLEESLVINKFGIINFVVSGSVLEFG